MGRTRSAFAIFVLAGAGCTVDAEGNGAARPRCTGDTDCPAPADPCSAGICRSGFCYDEPRQDGTLAEQTVGDCAVLVCEAGALQTLPDGNDARDDNPCTIDACTESVATHTPAPDTTACEINGQNGSCLAGACVIACFEDHECPFGDCQRPVCEANKCKVTIDDSNVPDDQNPCTSEVCAAGVLMQSNVPAGPAAGCVGECDGSGACLECTMNVPCADGSHCEANECYSCSNLVMDPGETGVDCGHPECGDCPGTDCTTGTTCASGFCVDLVCCETTVCGECQTCSPSGTCTQVPDFVFDETCSVGELCEDGACTPQI